MKHADAIAKLSLREKCALLSGATVFETHALPNKECRPSGCRMAPTACASRRARPTIWA